MIDLTSCQNFGVQVKIIKNWVPFDVNRLYKPCSISVWCTWSSVSFFSVLSVCGNLKTPVFAVLCPIILKYIIFCFFYYSSVVLTTRRKCWVSESITRKVILFTWNRKYKKRCKKNKKQRNKIITWHDTGYYTWTMVHPKGQGQR